MKSLYLYRLFTFLFLFMCNSETISAQWQTISTNTDIRTSIFFLDENNGIGTSTSDILRTSDGGFTWINKSQQMGTTWGGNDISFADGANGIVLKNNSFSISATDYYFTTDSGQSWQNPWTTFDEFVNQIQFTSTNVGYVLSTLGIKPGEIYKSINGGTSWNLIYQAIGDVRFSDFEFINDSIGLLVGFVQDTIPLTYFSTDGGLSWDSLPVNLALEHPLKLKMVNDSIGYLISGLSGIIYKSIDGFTTWNPIFNNSSLWLKEIHFPSADTGYFVAYDTSLAIDVIYQSVNAGVNWTKQTFDGFAVTDIYFLNANKGWVCGNNGNVAALGITTSSSDNSYTSYLPKIYPNPVNQVAVVQFDNPYSKAYTLTIYTIQGRLLYTLENITTDQVKINKGILTEGMYFLNLQTDNSKDTYTGKFTIR